MQQFNAIAGLPRAGTTLLCNILNQNPEFFASSTSPLPRFLGTLTDVWGSSVEVKGALGDDRTATESKIYRCNKAFMDAYYADRNERVVFDKSRAWNIYFLQLRKLYPQSKLIVPVRDLRDVMASIEKQHRKNPLLDDVPATKSTLMSRFNRMLSKDGLVGVHLNGIKDLIDRKEECLFVRYEDLVEFPEQVLNRIYCYLLEEEFEHDLENVVNVATDPDHLYLNKFPHTGSGKVTKSESQWGSYFSTEIAQGIVNTYPWFFKKFGYAAETPNPKDVGFASEDAQVEDARVEEIA